MEKHSDIERKRAKNRNKKVDSMKMNFTNTELKKNTRNNEKYEHRDTARKNSFNKIKDKLIK